jgi:hypothetical protein
MRRSTATLSRRLPGALLAVAATLGIAACGGSGPAPATTGSPVTVVVTTAPVTAPPIVAPTTPAADASPWPTDSLGNPVGWSVCHNTTHRFQIAYPAGWHTASVGPDDACALFDPAAFVAPDGPVIPTQQLWSQYQGSSAASYFTALFNPDFYTVTAHDDVTIAGRHAIRYTATALPPRGPSGQTYQVGTIFYGYIVEQSGHSLNVETYALPGDSTLPARKYIVDQAITTVRFL